MLSNLFVVVLVGCYVLVDNLIVFDGPVANLIVDHVLVDNFLAFDGLLVDDFFVGVLLDGLLGNGRHLVNGRLLGDWFVFNGRPVDDHFRVDDRLLGVSRLGRGLRSPPPDGRRGSTSSWRH